MAYKEHLAEQKNKLLKALAHLEYSYKKIQSLPEVLDQLDEESLETWESFCARFSRVADIFLTRYLRTYILIQDPGFAGSLRDFVNQAEKLGLVANADEWMSIRELRNISASDYEDVQLTDFFKNLKSKCLLLLSIKSFIIE